MKSMILIFVFCLNFEYIPLTYGKILIDQPPDENGLIVKKILLNFITEYITDEFLSFVVPKEGETPFQNELLKNLCNDPILSRYTYTISNILHNNTRRRHVPVHFLFIENREALQCVHLLLTKF